MPFSDPSNRAPVIELLQKFNAKTILELGVGYGTFGPLIKGAIPDITLYGVEIYRPYFDHIPKEYYEFIFHEDMRLFNYHHMKHLGTDAVIAIDSIEHLDKSDGMRLITHLCDLFPLIIISLPIVDYPQGESYGNEWETHRSQWKRDELESMGFFMTFTNNSIGVFFKTI